jgi:hypothetical protein
MNAFKIHILMDAIITLFRLMDVGQQKCQLCTGPSNITDGTEGALFQYIVLVMV